MAAKAPALLGIDVGTTQVKAVAWNLSGRGVAERSARCEYARGPSGEATRPLAPLWDRLSSAIRAACEEAEAKGYGIEAVGLTGHGNGLYLWQGDRFAGDAIGSQDVRARRWLDEAAEWRARFASLTGQRPYPGQTAVLLASVFRDAGAPGEKAAAWRPFFAKDWVGWHLTGVLCTDSTDAYAGGLIDPAGRPLTGWEVDVRPPGAVRGAVTPEAAEATGLRRGTPVAVGCIDLAASALGCGRASPGERVSIAGSWSIDVQLAPGMAASPVVNWVRAASDGLWMAALYTPAGTLVLDPLVRRYGLGFAEAEACARKAAQSPSSPLFEPDDESEAFTAPSSLEANRAEISPVAAGLLKASPPEALYSAYEGLAFLHRWHLEVLASSTGAELSGRPLALAGGLAASRFWASLLAGALGEEIESYGDVEAASRGAAMCAGVAVGAYGSWSEAARAAGAGERIGPGDVDVKALASRYESWRAKREKRLRSKPDGGNVTE